MSQPFIIGRNTKVTVALLPLGSRAEVVPQTITLTAPEPVAATSLAVSALTAPITASADSPLYLAFEDASDHSEKFVAVTAGAAAGATALTVAPLKSAIATASAAEYPVKLQARTGTDINTNVNDVSSVTFDSGGFEDGVISRVGYRIVANGNFLPLDAGFRICQYAFANFREVWITVKMPAPASGYTSGYIFKGPAAVGNAPLAIPADGVVTANLEFTVRGPLTVVEPS